MRVVQVINNAGLDKGGAERLARMLHLDLVADGIDAHLIAVQDCDAGALPNGETLGFPSARSAGAPAALRRRLRALVTPQTVVHAHLFPTIGIVSMLARFGQIAAPLAMTEHNTWNRRRGRVAGRWVDRALYTQFDQIAAISDQTRTALLVSYPHLANKVTVVTNGAELRFSKPVEKPDDAPILLTAARLAPAKNIDAALRALAPLTDRPWHYVIAGEGDERPRLEALTQELRLTDRVTFAGHVADLTDLLTRSEILILPSLWEGFGLAAVEAMNASMAVLASDVPGLRDIVEPVGSPLVAPDDIAGMTTALADLLDNQEKRRGLGRAGFDRAAIFDKTRMKDSYVAMWRRMLTHG